MNDNRDNKMFFDTRKNYVNDLKRETTTKGS